MTQTEHHRSLLPYLALVTGILSLGLTAMFVRWADAPGPITAFYRVSLSTIILLPFFIHRNARRSAVSRSTIIYPVLAGIFTALDFALWYTSVGFTTAANATLLGNTAPLWVALVSWLVFRDHFGAGFWIGLALALGGATLVMGTDFLLHPRLGIGDLMALCTGLFYAGYFVSTQFGRKTIDVLSHLWLVGLSASLSLFVINIVLHNAFTGYSNQTYWVFLSSALVSQIIGYQSITYALGHLPAAVVSPTMIGQPIVTALLAIPLLGETPTIIQVIGGLIALAGIYKVNQSHTQKREETNYSQMSPNIP